MIRNALEYWSPTLHVAEPEQLRSLDAYVMANEKNKYLVQMMIANRGEWNYNFGEAWEKMFEDARAKQAEATNQKIATERSKAAQSGIAFGGLFVLCAVLLVVHLTWAKGLRQSGY
jgi:hypothetical protein